MGESPGRANGSSIHIGESLSEPVKCVVHGSEAFGILKPSIGAVAKHQALGPLKVVSA